MCCCLWAVSIFTHVLVVCRADWWYVPFALSLASILSRGQDNPRDWSPSNDHTVKADLRSIYCGRGEQLLQEQEEKTTAKATTSVRRGQSMSLSPSKLQSNIKQKTRKGEYSFFSYNCLLDFYAQAVWVVLNILSKRFKHALIGSKSQESWIWNSWLSSIFGLVAALIML